MIDDGPHKSALGHTVDIKSGYLGGTDSTGRHYIKTQDGYKDIWGTEYKSLYKINNIDGGIAEIIVGGFAFAIIGPLIYAVGVATIVEIRNKIDNLMGWPTQEELLRTYPALSVAIDSNKNFYYAIDPDEKTAIAKAIDSCETVKGRKCQEAETAKAQEPACISVAPSYDPQFTYYSNIFHKGETDNLTSSKAFSIASIQFSGKSAKNFEVGPVSIFCNSEEMRPDLDKAVEDENKSSEWLKEESKTASRTPMAAPPSQKIATAPLPKKEFFSVTAAGLNVRTGPSTTFGSVATLRQGACLTVEYGAAAQNGFIEIMGKTAGGARIDGYVSTRYLSAIAGTPAACVATLK